MFVVEMSFSKKGRKTAGGPRVTNRDVTNTTAESVQQVHTAQIHTGRLHVCLVQNTLEGLTGSAKRGDSTVVWMGVGHASRVGRVQHCATIVLTLRSIYLFNMKFVQ